MRRSFLRGAAALLLAAAAGACIAPPTKVAVGQDMPMGGFVLRAESVRAYSRAHQGVPWEVEVRFTVTGGNKFERDDFAEAVNRRGKVIVRAANGWHDRGWLLYRDEARTRYAMQVNPPLGSQGYTVEIGNPYGKPVRYLLDLGQ